MFRKGTLDNISFIFGTKIKIINAIGKSCNKENPKNLNRDWKIMLYLRWTEIKLSNSILQRRVVGRVHKVNRS